MDADVGLQGRSKLQSTRFDVVAQLRALEQFGRLGHRIMIDPELGLDGRRIDSTIDPQIDRHPLTGDGGGRSGASDSRSDSCRVTCCIVLNPPSSHPAGRPHSSRHDTIEHRAIRMNSLRNQVATESEPADGAFCEPDDPGTGVNPTESPRCACNASAAAAGSVSRPPVSS